MVITSGLVLPPQITGEEQLKMKNTDLHCSCLLVPVRHSKPYGRVTGVFVGWMLPVPIAIWKCLMEYKQVS